MDFSIAFLNCGPRRRSSPNWDAIASTLYLAVGNRPHVVGLCELYGGPQTVAAAIKALARLTRRTYHCVVSQDDPRAGGLAILADMDLGRLYSVGDDGEFRHGRDWRRWLAGRVELADPATAVPSRKQFVVIVNHWPSMTQGRQDTMADREIVAWEVGRWMCSKDPNAAQVDVGLDARPVPVWRQPCVVMGDFNCEPGSPELRSRRKFTLQAMRTEPTKWNDLWMQPDTHALVYDLAWRRLTVGPSPTVPGTFHWTDDELHSPAMLDRVLVTRPLWAGPDLNVVLNGGQEMEITTPVKKCTDHCAVSITVNTNPRKAH